MKARDIREACEQALAWLTTQAEDKRSELLSMAHRKSIALHILRELLERVK